MAHKTQPSGTKQRGRTAQTHPDPIQPSKAPFSHNEESATTRPISSGSGKLRGDRRDMSKRYAGTNRRQPNHVDPTGPGSRSSDY